MQEHLIIDGERVQASDGGTFEVDRSVDGRATGDGRQGDEGRCRSRGRPLRKPRSNRRRGAGSLPAERGRIMICGSRRRSASAPRSWRRSRAATTASRCARRARTCRWRRGTSSSLRGVADKIMGHTIPLGPGFLDFTVREPIGVSAQIVPWNYPIQIGARGVAPALAAGCAVVLKPSSEAPMTALQLGQIALECGLPPGVLNVVPGTGAEAGVALASHPRHQPAHVHGIGGRRHRGREARGRQRRAGRHGARRQVAERRLCRRRSRSGGARRRQRHLSERRPDVFGRIAPARRACGARCARRAAGRRARGDARRPGRERSRTWARSSRNGSSRPSSNMSRWGREEGATVAARRRPSDGRVARRAGSIFSRRCSIASTPDMRVAQEEIFGPVLAIIPFDDADEAAAMANRSEYGLVAGIWTRDINKAMALASRIKSGQVYINTYGAGGGVELPVRRVQEERIRPRKRPRIARELHAGEECLHQVRLSASASSGSATWAGPWRRICAARGLRSTVCDLNAAPVRPLEALGARTARDAAGVAAASDIVFTMLPDSAAVSDVVAGPDGLLAHLPAGSVHRRHEHDRPARDRPARRRGGRARHRVRRRAGRAPGQSRRARRVAVHGRRRRGDRSRASSRCSTRWARPSITAVSPAPACARSW